MQRITIEGTEYKLPTRWEEVTLGYYVDIVNAKDYDAIGRLAIITGIPLKTLTLISDDSLLRIALAIQFLSDGDALESKLRPAQFKLDPAKLSWGKLEKFKQLLQKRADGEDDINLASKLLVIYRPTDFVGHSLTENDYLSMPITDILNDIRFFFRHMKSSANALSPCMSLN